MSRSGRSEGPTTEELAKAFRALGWQPTEPFAAACACPRCGYLAVHHMRAPRPKPERGPVRVSNWNDMILEWHSWGGITGPDESRYEVMRTCTECGHSWGQA